MKRYGNLFEDIVSFENLVVAVKRAFRGKKDKARVAQFYFDMENELLCIREELRNKTYRPRPLWIFRIREPKVREIGASDFRDRVVHHAVCNIIEPILEGGVMSITVMPAGLERERTVQSDRRRYLVARIAIILNATSGSTLAVSTMAS